LVLSVGLSSITLTSASQPSRRASTDQRRDSSLIESKPLVVPKRSEPVRLPKVRWLRFWLEGC